LVCASVKTAIMLGRATSESRCAAGFCIYQIEQLIVVHFLHMGFSARHCAIFCLTGGKNSCPIRQ
jgi:hypothetical protein